MGREVRRRDGSIRGGCVAAVARAVRAHCERAGESVTAVIILPAILAATALRPRGTNPRGWPSRSPPRRRARGGAYERVVRELLCADPSTNDDDDDDRVGDDDDRYDDRYDDDDDAFARTSYAFEFASLFDGRHLAARTVAALRALIESSDRFFAARIERPIGCAD